MERKPPGRDTVNHSPVMEQHFKCSELAVKWHMSESTVFKMFVDEDGVIRIGSRNPKKRTKISIRIPLSVAERVYARLLLKSG
jgi:hypothetical protein